MDDLISIIVPVYNVEKYLKECLESIINQTYKNIEIILINDGSTDKSLEMLKTYKEKDNRIVIVNRENKGLLYTRVDGYKIAKGKYITFVDSDDWLEKDAVEILYDNIIKYAADVVRAEYGYNDSKVPSGNLADIDEKKFIVKEDFEPEFYDMFLKNMNIHTAWGQMFKRDLLSKDINNIDTNITLGEDLEFNIQLYKNMKSILFINNVIYHYRYNPLSITRRFTEKNVKSNIISATKCYYNVYKKITNFEIKHIVEYKKAILTRLLDEVIKWQIDLIGVLKDKNKSIEYLKWYYYEYDIVKEVMKEIQLIGVDRNKLKYNLFYKKVYVNINYTYSIGKFIYGIKKIYRKLKNNK